MEESLYQDINATLDPKATWKPDAIWFPTNWRTATSEEEAEWVNLMDYIGKDGTKEVLKIEKREMWSDPLNKESRQSLVTEIENVCAVAGFQIFCKGWEGQRMCMRFNCARGRLYKDQKKPRASKQYNTKTARPKTIEDNAAHPYLVDMVKLAENNSAAYSAMMNGMRETLNRTRRAVFATQLAVQSGNQRGMASSNLATERRQKNARKRPFHSPTGKSKTKRQKR